MKNQKAVDYRHFKGFTALFAALFLVLTASCVSRKECLVCDEVTEGYRFVRFDSAFVSCNSLRDIWVLDSLRTAVPRPLGDTLIIFSRLSCSAVSNTANMLVKSDSKYISLSYRPTRVPSYVPEVEYYDSFPYTRPEDSLMEQAVFLWNIDTLKSILEYQSTVPKSEMDDCMMIRLVTKRNRIVRWEEYRFMDPFYWTNVPDPTVWPF